MMDEGRLIRLPEIMSRIGMGKTKVYAMIKTGEFPAPVKYGRTSLWHSKAVDRWIRSVRSAQTNEELL